MEAPRHDLGALRALDDAAWLALEREYCGRLQAYVSRRVADPGACEDIVQETFLGALRGIATYDPVFTFEQYLFGICRNRLIDHRRRLRPLALGASDPDDERAGDLIERAVDDAEPPSALVRRAELAQEGARVLGEVLRAWVQETWEQGELERLMVVEALLFGGWKNREVRDRLGVRDDSAVAGIKFRALKRMRELVLERRADRAVSGELADALARAESVDLDVRAVWARARASCPARHWLARHAAGTLEPAQGTAIAFHLETLRCPWCQANADDLAHAERAGVAELIEKVGASTLRWLASRRGP